MADEKKISELTERFTAVTQDEYFLISEYTGVPTIYESKKIKKSILLGYKQFVATLSQTGTSDPTANILCGDLGTVTFTRNSVGNYTATGTGLFALTKLVVRFGNEINTATTSHAFITVLQSSITVNSFDFTTRKNTGDLFDGILSETGIEIRVYL
jgi:hypothetical protein